METSQKLEGKPKRESPKRTISAGGGLGPLQMVSEPDTGRCVSEEAELRRGWTRDGVPARMLSLEGEWIGGPTSIEEGNECQRGCWVEKGVDCEIPHRLEWRTMHSS